MLNEATHDIVHSVDNKCDITNLIIYIILVTIVLTFNMIIYQEWTWTSFTNIWSFDFEDYWYFNKVNRNKLIVYNLI